MAGHSNHTNWRFFKRQVEATLRDTWLLLREFQWPLLAFGGSILGGGSLYYLLAQQTQESVGSVVEAVYHVLGLVFLSPIETFPNVWYLQLFYFLMPIIGLSILAQGSPILVFFFSIDNLAARSGKWLLPQHLAITLF